MIVYSALGDSITFGYSASNPQRAYPGRLQAELQNRRGGCAVDVLAQPGWTSGDLRAAVLGGGADGLARASVITVWVGGNDVAYAGLRALRNGQAGLGGAQVQQAQQLAADTVSAYGRNLAALVTAVRKASPAAQILLCTQYNPFPRSPIAVQGIAALNQATRAVASQLRVQVAPVHSWFAGQEAMLIEGYRSGRLEDALRSPRLPIHPNDAGHAVVARGLGRLIR